MPQGNDPRRFDLLEAGFLLLILLAPFFFGAVHLWAFMALNAVLFFLLFVYPQAVFQIPVLPLPVSCGFFAVLLFTVLQASFLSLNSYDSAMECFKWFAFASAFLLLQLLPEKSLYRLLTAFLIMGAIESLYGLYQTLGGREKVLWIAKETHLGYVTGTYLNRNHLAGFLELALGVAAGLWFERLKARKAADAVFIGVIFVLMLTAFFRTGSRMGVLVFSMAFLFFTFNFLRHSKKSALSVSVLAAVVAVSAIINLNGFMPRFFNPDDEFNLLQSERWLVWKDTVRMIQDHAWQGIGLGNFEWVYPSYQSAQLFMGWDHAHQDYLELAAGLGLPAFSVLAVSFAFLYHTCFSGRKSIMVYGLGISITAFLLHGLTDFNFAIPANAFLFILLLGIAFSLSRRETAHE